MAESVRRMRVAVGGFYHETNTRARARTRLADFKAYQYAEGTGLAPTFAGTNSEIGGMLDWLEENGHEPMPLLFAAAVPSGPLEHPNAGALSGTALRRRPGRTLSTTAGLGGRSGRSTPTST